MPRKSPPHVLHIKEAAKSLGVSEVTLRRWDKSGRFPSSRHPINGYRCYQRDAVLRLREQIRSGSSVGPTLGGTEPMAPLAGELAHSGNTTQALGELAQQWAAEVEQREREAQAREAQLRAALQFALSHGRDASGPIFGAVATLAKDSIDWQAVQMIQEALTAVVRKTARERQGVHDWHARRLGCNPKEDAVPLLDLARAVKLTAHLIHLEHPLVAHTGVAAVAYFRDDYLMPLYGKRTPSLEQLQDLFTRHSTKHKKRKLTTVGIVAHIVHHVRLFGAASMDLERTRKRVNAVLARHAKRQPR